MNNIRDSIGWADYSWNPIVGCARVSEGCVNCYAEGISRRFGYPWGRPVFMPKRLDEPRRLRKPARIFCCSMSDMFHHDVDTRWIDRILAVMEGCPQHTFIVLTKRAQNIGDKLYCVTDGHPDRWLGEGDFPRNLCVGVSVENQERADDRVWHLLRAWPGDCVVSAEPMLGPIDLSAAHCYPWGFRVVRWVIAGPENGAGRRPCRDEWIDSLREQCVRGGIAFWDKRRDGVVREWPKGWGKGEPLRKKRRKEEEPRMNTDGHG